jgi:hypothetical protein
MFDPQQFPRKLNLGCGPDIRRGYVNVDMHASFNPDLVGDVSNLHMLPSEFYEEAVAQDVLEHLPRMQTLEALCEWNRLLKVGGLLKVRVPSLEGLAAMFMVTESFDQHSEYMQCLFGSQGISGDFHYTSFTRLLIKGYLERAGFRVNELALVHGWLFDVQAEKVSGATNELRDERLRLLAITDNDEFLNALYRSLLKRDIDPSGKSLYSPGLNGSLMTKESVYWTLMASPERKALVDRGAA